MLKIFNGQTRGLGKADQTVFLQVFVQFRDYLHYFRDARLAVFLCIALHMDEDGWAYPTIKTICRETGYSQPTVTKALTELCALEIDGSRVLLAMQWRTPGGTWDRNRYLLFPTEEEVRIFGVYARRPREKGAHVEAAIGAGPVIEKQEGADSEELAHSAIITQAAAKQAQLLADLDDTAKEPSISNLSSVEPSISLPYTVEPNTVNLLLRRTTINKNHNQEDKNMGAGKAPAPVAPGWDTGLSGNAVKNPGAYRALEKFYDRLQEQQASAPNAFMPDPGEWPEDVYPWLQKYCSLWLRTAPSRPKGKSGGEFALWITDLRQLENACAEFGLHLLEELHAEWLQHMQDNNGAEPFTNSRPGALIKLARAKAGRMRLLIQQGEKSAVSQEEKATAAKARLEEAKRLAGIRA